MKTLAVLLALQDPGALEQWVRKLADDSIEVRERAAAELLKAGPAGEEAVRRAAREGSEDLRREASSLLEEIARRAEARNFDAGPSLVTLRRENAPLREALDEIRKQARTPLDFSAVPAERKVTIDVKDAPLPAALDALARAGGVHYEVEVVAPGGPRVVFSEKKFVNYPTAVAEQFWVRLTSVHAQETYDLAGGSTLQTMVCFRWGWEAGTRPLQTTVRLEEVKDEGGRALKMHEGPEDSHAHWTAGRRVEPQVGLGLPDAPSPESGRLEVVKGAVEFVLPEALEILSFADPERQEGKARRGKVYEARLVSVSRGKDRFRARLEIAPRDRDPRFEVRLLDAGGKDFAGYSSVMTPRPEKTELDLEFRAPEGAAAAELRISAPVGERRRRVPFEFRDVPLR